MHSLPGLYRQGQFPEVACSAPPHDDPFRISSRPGVDTVEWILGNMALPSSHPPHEEASTPTQGDN